MDAKAIAEVQDGHTRIERVRLLIEIKKNRDKHADECERALVGWRAAYASQINAIAGAMQEHAADMVDHATNERFNYNAFNIPDRPNDHTKEYDRILRRFEMSRDDEIFLSHSDFDKYVLDEWRWKDEHERHVTSYLAGK